MVGKGSWVLTRRVWVFGRIRDDHEGFTDGLKLVIVEEECFTCEASQNVRF